MGYQNSDVQSHVHMRTLSVTIPNGETDSEPVNMHGATAAAIYIPDSNFTGTQLTFKVSGTVNSGTAVVLRKDLDGTPYQVILDAGKEGMYALDAVTMYCARQIIVVSSASEGAERNIQIIPYSI